MLKKIPHFHIQFQKKPQRPTAQRSRSSKRNSPATSPPPSHSRARAHTHPIRSSHSRQRDLPAAQLHIEHLGDNSTTKPIHTHSPPPPLQQQRAAGAARKSAPAAGAVTRGCRSPLPQGATAWAAASTPSSLPLSSQSRCFRRRRTNSPTETARRRRPRSLDLLLSVSSSRTALDPERRCTEPAGAAVTVCGPTSVLELELKRSARARA